MGVKQKGIGLIAFLFLVITLSGSAFASVNTTVCGGLAPNEVHILQNDISSTNTCITLASHIVFDGQGYNIYVNCTGFYTLSELDNVTIMNTNIIKNGTCVGTSTGIFTPAMDNLVIDNVTITSTVTGDNTHLDGLRICPLDEIPSGSNCTNLTYSDIIYKGNGTGIILGNPNVTYSDINIQDVNLNSTTLNTSVFSANGIYIGNPASGSFSITNATIDSGKECITIAGSNTTATDITCEAGIDGLLLLGSNITVSNAIITPERYGLSLSSPANDITIDGLTVNGGDNGIRSYLVSNMNMSNITLLGDNDTTSDAMYMLLPNNLTLDDFYIQYYSLGLFIYQSSQGISISNGEIYDINLTGSSGNGINFYEANGSVTENIIINNTGSGAFGYIGVAKPSENHIATNISASYANHGNLTSNNSAFFVASGNNIIASESYFSDSSRGIGLAPVVGYYDLRQNLLFYNNTVENNQINARLIDNYTNVSFNDSSYGNLWGDYTGCDIQTDQIGDTPYSINDTYDYLPFTTTRCYPTVTEFTGAETTNFTAEPDLANVTGLILADSNVNVTWSGSIDVASEDFDSAITFANNSASVSSSALNSSAIVVFKGVGYDDTGSFRVLRDGSNCTDCSILTASPVSFSVTGFSTYTTEEIITPTEVSITGMQTVANSVLYLIPVILVIVSLFLVVSSLYQSQLDIKKLVIGLVILLIVIIFSGVIWSLIV